MDISSAGSQSGLRFAVVGCSHGALDMIYEQVAILEQKNGYTIDAVLCCGDFQAIRNAYDLETMVSPAKYRKMCDFWKYYKGEKIAPKLTIFVGGNHEAIVHQREMYYGGWAAPNIYFLGYSGLLDIGGVKIGGFSGIYDSKFLKSGHYEVAPYTKDTLHTSHYVRLYELWKLAHLGGRVRIDAMMSHDWPEYVAHYGDYDWLLRSRPNFSKSLLEHSLGCVEYLQLLKHLKPVKWCSGHMHVKFRATIAHADVTPNPDTQKGKMVDITRLLQEKEAIDRKNPPRVPKEAASVTEFLALDKPLPGREFMDVIHFPFASGERSTEEVLLNELGEPLVAPPRLCHDLEWLSIVKAAHDYLPNHKGGAKLLPQLHPNAISKSRAWIVQNCLNGDQFNWSALEIKHSQFARSAPVHEEGAEPLREALLVGPQTDVFLRWLDLDPSKLQSTGDVPINVNKANRTSKKTVQTEDNIASAAPSAPQTDP